MSTYNTGDASNMIYDDAAFQSFLLSLLAVYCIPTLIFRVSSFIRRKNHVKTPLEEAKEGWCVCSLCQKKKQRLQPKRSLLNLSDVIFISLSILLIFTTLNVYRTNINNEPPFDPFRILQVDEIATQKQIKRAYRRLSIIHHPDKNQGDSTAGARFIKISKAYAALTDPISKENYKKYGNPDGRVATTFSLGLPQWVEDRRNAILLSYFVFLLVVFPLVLGLWWRRRRIEFTSDILTETFILYRETLQQTGRFRDLLGAFCGSVEFQNLYKPENDDALAEIADALRRAGRTDVRKTKTVVEPTPAHAQNLLVMTTYLARMAIPQQLNYIVEKMLVRMEALTKALADTVGAFHRPDCEAAWDRQFMHGHTIFMSNAFVLAQSLTHAVEEKSSVLMQIPHFTEKETRYCLNSRTPSIKTIYDLMKVDMSEQRKLLRGLSDDQFLDVKAFCDRYPSANLDVSEAVVEGEEDGTVHAGDTVTVRAKVTIMRRSGSIFSPHTPNIPHNKQEAWWIWLADERLRCPIDVKRLTWKMAKGYEAKQRRVEEEDEQLIKETKDDVLLNEKLLEDPRVTRFAVKFKFQAPRPGMYNLEVKTVCDCYSGASKTKVIRMNVEKEIENGTGENVKYFDSDDESESESELESDAESTRVGESEEEYEYIEVSDEESDEGDFGDEDEHGISVSTHGDPAS